VNQLPRKYDKSEIRELTMKQNSFVKLACFSLAGVIALAQIAQAQPGRGGQGGGPGGFGGMMGFTSSGLGLLSDEKVQKELELDEAQLARVRELQEEMRAEIQDSMRDRRGGGFNREAMQEIRERMEEINKEFDGLIEKELLPHQKQRLKQLVYRSQARRTGGATGGGLPDDIIKELDITDEQKAKMEEKAKSVREELEKKIANLRKQAEEEVLSVLSKSQIDKYNELMGDPFEFGQPNFGGFGQGGRGQGGRGEGGGRGGRGEGGGRGQGGGGGRGGDRDF
jgi:Spy/CpxP family protein refolding chaperone